MYRAVPINQTFGVRLIDRFYRCSFCDIGGTFHSDNEGDVMLPMDFCYACVDALTFPACLVVGTIGLVSSRCGFCLGPIQAGKQPCRFILLGVLKGVYTRS